jgi:hypothetical protein
VGMGAAQGDDTGNMGMTGSGCQREEGREEGEALGEESCVLETGEVARPGPTYRGQFFWLGFTQGSSDVLMRRRTR